MNRMGNEKSYNMTVRHLCMQIVHFYWMAKTLGARCCVMRSSTRTSHTPSMLSLSCMCIILTNPHHAWFPLLRSAHAFVVTMHVAFIVQTFSSSSWNCRSRRVATCSYGDQDAVSLDTFKGFESFCWRTQETLCVHTAAADGLGTFERTPHTTTTRKPWTREATRAMRGGRAFQSAVIAVWRTNSRTSLKDKMLVSLDTRTNEVVHNTDAVGLSLKMIPRNKAAPLLRADLHYFQVGGGDTSWWFSGAADLTVGAAAEPNAFAGDVEMFLASWQKLCDKHRLESAKSELVDSRAFLEECYGNVKANRTSTEGLDRTTSFAFISDVVDRLLPSYLPLVSSNENRHTFVVDAPKHASHSSFANAFDFGWEQVAQNEQVQNFGLKGGASCESAITRASPLGWWRFTLTPSKRSPAGRKYNSMRNDESSGRTPSAYL